MSFKISQNHQGWSFPNYWRPLQPADTCWVEPDLDGAWSGAKLGAEDSAEGGQGDPSGLVRPPVFILPLGFLRWPWAAKATLMASKMYL